MPDQRTVPRIHPDETARVPFGAPITSHEAADGNDVSASHAFVHYLFTVYGSMADFELIGRATEYTVEHDDAIVFSESRLRSARHELTEAGVIEFTGGYRMRPRPARQFRHQVWQLTDDRVAVRAAVAA